MACPHSSALSTGSGSSSSHTAGTCPSVRPELEALPANMRGLDVDERGYPIPWFVARLDDGSPEFRAMDPGKWLRAIRDKLCWVCGGPIVVPFYAFVIGPMCGVNRTTSEPPCHRSCAEWSARNCPFLSRPHMVRREDETRNNPQLIRDSAGIALTRNPGVALVWNTDRYELFNDGSNRPLIRLGAASSISWWAEGRPATRDEILHSVKGGLPKLRELAELQQAEEPESGAIAYLDEALATFEKLLPA